VPELDTKEPRPRRARRAEQLALTGALLALAGIVLAFLFAILSRAWSDAACESLPSAILNVMPGIAEVALALGLLCGLAAIVLRPSEWRLGASAASFAIVGFGIASIPIWSFYLRACS
jgi:hypothetical protein